MFDWFQFKAAARQVRRIKRDAMQKERDALHAEVVSSKDEVIKAVRMEAYAYRKALGTFVDLEEDNLVSRVEKPTSGDYHEILEAMVDQYAPGIAKGAIKSVIRKRKDEINAAAEKFINERVTQVMTQKEEAGEIKRIDPKKKQEMAGR